jgi:hypothetical protein
VTFAAMRSRLSNTVHRDRARSIRAADLLSPGSNWATIDYDTIVPRTVEGGASWEMKTTAEAHGLLLWFDTMLAAGHEFSTAPGLDGVYPQLFLPWTEPVLLKVGDTVAVKLWAPAEGDPWGWNTEIVRGPGDRTTRFKQSSFLGDLSPLERTPVQHVSDERGAP